MYLTSTEKDQIKNKKSNAVLVVYYACIVPTRNSYKYHKTNMHAKNTHRIQ